MALRAAHNAGIYVPTETIDHATKDYVLRCQNADGGFMYMLSAGGDSAFPRSAAAVVALNSAGIYGGPEINKALDYLMQFRPAEGATRRGLEGYYEYGHYYAVQAMWQAGGDRWARWYPAIRDELISRQQEDGSWVSSFGPEYATAMSAHRLADAGEPVADLPEVSCWGFRDLGIWGFGDLGIWERGRG